MRSRYIFVILIIPGLLFLGGWVFSSSSTGQSDSPPAKTKEPKTGFAPGTNVSENGVDAGLNPLAIRLEYASMQLATAGDQPTRDELLAILGQDLANSSAEVAAAAVLDFLASETDATTGQEFAVDSAGNLESAPTLRTFLLDFLGRLSVPAAAGYARELLEAEPTSAAEWALALRDYARGTSSNPSGGRTDLFFRTKVHELLAHQGWADAPTPGFLYAMDAAVYSGDLESTSLLAALAARPGDTREKLAVRTVAFDKLARLAYDDFASLAPLLDSDPRFGTLDPAQRGVLYAYADVRSPEEREAVGRFLASSRPGDQATEAFAATYPNFSLGLAAELLTEAPPRDELDDIDAVLAAWEASKSWAPTIPALVSTSDRLDRLVRSIEAGIADR